MTTLPTPFETVWDDKTQVYREGITMMDQTNTDFQQLLDQAEGFAAAGRMTEAGRLFRLAGETAAADHAVGAAQDCFDRALSLLPAGELAARYQILLTREAGYGLLGNREAQEEDLISLAVLADALDDDEKRAAVAVRMANFKLVTGLFHDAISVVGLATRIAALAGATKVVVRGQIVWGRALIQLGDYGAAATQLARAQRQADTLADRGLAADCAHALGLLAQHQGELAEARDRYETALQLYREDGDRLGESHLLNDLGHVSQTRGHLSAAQATWEAALAGCYQVGDRGGQGMALGNLASLLIDLGQYERAQVRHEEARQVCAATDHCLGQTRAMINQGLAAQRLGHHRKAQQLAGDALRLARKMKSKRLEAEALTVLAQAQQSQRQLEEAEDNYWHLLALWHDLDQEQHSLEARAGLAAVNLAQGNMGRARAMVAPILNALQDAKSDGFATPLQVYLTCHDVLAAADDPRATEVLTAGQERLQRRAALIADPIARHSFLENVPVHRQLQKPNGAGALTAH